MNIYSDMTWAQFENIRFAPLFVIACGLIWYRVWWRMRTAQLVQKRLLRYFSPTQQIVKGLLLTGVCVMLQLALLQPQRSDGTKTIMQEGRDVLIALDISRSMLAQDAPENRLSYAKKNVRALLQQLACDRVGLMLFSGSTFVQCPLTNDYHTFHLFLDAVDVETISSGTTAIDQAIDQAIRTFSHIPGRKNSLLLICTDGEDFSHNLQGVKERALQAHMTICTMGIGSCQGAPIPMYNEKKECIGHQKDADGTVVISRLNEALLSKLAQETGGMYIHATEQDHDISAMKTVIQRMEKERFVDRTIEQKEELYPYMIAISFFSLLLEWLL